VATGSFAPGTAVTSPLLAVRYTRLEMRAPPVANWPLVVVCSVAVAACGSAAKPASSGSSGVSAGVRFAECMRAHGVPSFPDPTANGQSQSPDRVDKHAPAFHTAQRACNAVAAELGDAKPRKPRAQQLRYAECMRAHGVPSFPDPLPGGGFDVPSAVDTGSPAFTSANGACGGST
jgi:hypothetical protein